MVVIFRWVYGRQSKGGVTERRRGIRLSVYDYSVMLKKNLD